MTTNLITEEDVTAAELAAEDATRERQAVERSLATAAYRPELGELLTGAATRARHSAVVAVQLRERRALQLEALAVRERAEADAAADLPGVEKALTAARDAVVASFVAAERSLLAAMDAAVAYERAIADADKALIARGLPAVDDLGEHATGGGGNGQVRLSGRWWVSLPAAALLSRSLAVVAETALDRRHTLAQVGRGHLLGYSAAKWSDLVRELDEKVPRARR